MSSRLRQGQPRPSESLRRDQGSAPLASPHQEQVTEATPAPYFQRAMLWQWPLALIMLIGFAPIMILVAFLIRITSPGPATYRQTRLGRHGKAFTLYKFRSMHLDAESKTGAVWAKPGDPRITLLGKICRNLHLDELPQLFNVIRGEMALVGPRPERPEFTTKIEKEVPTFAQRLCIRPGITGLAQVHQGPDVDMNSVRRKLVYDLEYVRCASTWLDWRIMVCTLLRATEKTRLWGIRWFRLPNPSVAHLSLPQLQVSAAHQTPQADLCEASSDVDIRVESNGEASHGVASNGQDTAEIAPQTETSASHNSAVNNGHSVTSPIDDSAESRTPDQPAHAGPVSTVDQANNGHSNGNNGVSKSSHSVAPAR